MGTSADDAVCVLEPAAAYDLRRRVLRGADPDADVAYPSDFSAGAFHLGWRDLGGRVIAIASLAPSPPPESARAWWESDPSRPGLDPGSVWRLRGMAVEPDHHGHGLGTALLGAAMTRLRACRGTVMWCNARDTALGFYKARGWQIVGEGFMTEIGVAHHVAVRSLTP